MGQEILAYYPLWTLPMKNLLGMFGSFNLQTPRAMLWKHHLVHFY